MTVRAVSRSSHSEREFSEKSADDEARAESAVFEFDFGFDGADAAAPTFEAPCAVSAVVIERDSELVDERAMS